MKKTIITRDLSLNKVDKTAAKSGILLVQQDSIGMHILTLAEGNRGSIDQTNFGLQAGQISQLNWINDDNGITYWTSKILTPEVALAAPQKITDLVFVYVDSIGVTLRWTAPQGNPPNPVTRVDRYTVKISNAPMNEWDDISNVTSYKQSIIPKAPGQEENLVLTGLQPSTKYYVAIFSDCTLFGKTRRSLNSNNAVFITNTIDEDNNQSTPPSRIYLAKEQFMGVQFNTLKDESVINSRYKFDESRLAELDGVYDANGVPQGEPPTEGLKVSEWGSFNSTWYNTPFKELIIDMYDLYNLHHCYIYLSNTFNIGEFKFMASADGINKNTVAATDAIDNNEWYKIDFNQLLGQNVRYFHIGVPSPSFNIRGIILYGKKVSSSDIKGYKAKQLTTIRPIDRKIGTNTFFSENDPNLIAGISGVTRFYNDGNWVYGSGFRDPGQSQNATDEDVTFSAETSYMWNYDQRMAMHKAAGFDILFTLSSASPYSKPQGYDYTRAMHGKAHNPGIDYNNVSVTTNPASYSQRARIAYNMAARWGNNTNVPDTYIQLNGDSVKKGLGLVKYWEFGNEIDVMFDGADRYHNAQEYAAYLSACYDGHKGLLGQGYGVKQADPDAIVITQGAISIGRLGYLKEMMNWWDVNRGLGDYPFDAFNFHLYQAWSLFNQTELYNANHPAFAVSPEDMRGEIQHVIPMVVDFRNKFLSNKEIWITETGYDEHWTGIFSPPFDTQFERSRHKSFWLMRQFLIDFNLGIDMVFQYWYANRGIRLEDFSPNQKNRDIFYTCGYTDGITDYNDQNRKPLMSWYYMSAFKNEMKDMLLIHPLKERGQNKIVENLIPDANPRIWAFGLKNNVTEETAIVIWRDSQAFETQTLKVYVDPSQVTVKYITFLDAEIRKDSQGVETILNSTVEDNRRYVDITISECPSILYTQLVGTPILKTPLNLRLNAESTSSIKLVWDDHNIGTNQTKIFHSLNPSDSFELIYSGYLEGEFIATDLQPLITHYFKVQFLSGESVSEISDSVGGQTTKVVPEPINFVSASQAISSINLSWGINLSGSGIAAIESFSLFRSNTANGQFTLLAELSGDVFSYTDLGLIEDTTYYYKIRAKFETSYSNFTLAIGVTTDSATLNPSQPVSGYLSYNGGSIKLKMSVPLANAGSSQPGFSAVINVNGTPTLINITNVSVDPNDSTTLILTCSNVESSNALTLSFDNSLATLNSAFGVPTPSFFNFALTNQKATAVITKRYKVNLSGSSADDIAGWNNVNLAAVSGGSRPQVIATNLIDDSGQVSNVAFAIPNNFDQSQDAQGRKFVQGDTLNNYKEIINPIDVFPSEIGLWGLGLNYGGESILETPIIPFSTAAVFTNLDAGKYYNIKFVSFPIYDNPTRGTRFANLQNISQTDVAQINSKSLSPLLQISGNAVNYPVLGEMVGTNNSIPFPNSHKFGVNVTTLGTYIGGLFAIVLEEITL